METVGIVGAGDFGSQLAVQVGSATPNIHVFDPNVDKIPAEARGVDLKTPQTVMLAEPIWHNTIDSLLDATAIVHWCAPLDALEEVSFQRHQTVVLHDSVMSHSRAAKELIDGPKVNIAHLLMNRYARVVISTDSDDPRAIDTHMKAIGLNPILMSTDEHDIVMAKSQAPMAILHELFGDDLAALSEDGLLTPSGEDLAKALQDRAAKWTPTTLATILTNPKIPDLIEMMRKKIASEE